jgi:hypothetical protein
MRHHRITRTTVLGLALAALAAPAAGAGQDLRNPDTRSIRPQTGTPASGAQRPSADHAFPGLAKQGAEAIPARPSQDLRSADSRDAAEGRGTFSAPEVTVVTVPEPSVRGSAPSAGLDWTAAGIGAGGTLAIVLLVLASTLTVVRRRQGGPVASRPATTV